MAADVNVVMLAVYNFCVARLFPSVPFCIYVIFVVSVLADIADICSITFVVAGRRRYGKLPEFAGFRSRFSANGAVVRVCFAVGIYQPSAPSMTFGAAEIFAVIKTTFRTCIFSYALLGAGRVSCVNPETAIRFLAVLAVVFAYVVVIMRSVGFRALLPFAIFMTEGG